MAPTDLQILIMDRIAAADAGAVWTPTDFVDLGRRDAVDKALQRLVKAGRIRRIERGLYDRPRKSSLTRRPTGPDYCQILAALARRAKVRMLLDGMTAANDLGLTDAVPAKVVVHTDTRRRSIKLENLTIEFKSTAPSRLYWAGRPAMRVVQALHWLKDLIPARHEAISSRLEAILADPNSGPAIRRDLADGFSTLPTWMQGLVRELLDRFPSGPDATHDRPPERRRGRRKRSA